MQDRRWFIGSAGALAAPAILGAAPLALAQSPAPSWLEPSLLAKAKAEGGSFTEE